MKDFPSNLIFKGKAASLLVVWLYMIDRIFKTNHFRQVG